jgi:hypothetical protein
VFISTDCSAWRALKHVLIMNAKTRKVAAVEPEDPSKSSGGNLIPLTIGYLPTPTDTH